MFVAITGPSESGVLVGFFVVVRGVVAITLAIRADVDKQWINVDKRG